MHCDISHLALGDTSDSFFIRFSDDDDMRNWHYRWAGLPPQCERAIQKSISASSLCKCEHRLHHWTFGRLRGVTLGQGGGWVLYREGEEGRTEAMWGGKYLPRSLCKALTEGQRTKTINVRTPPVPPLSLRGADARASKWF